MLPFTRTLIPAVLVAIPLLSLPAAAKANDQSERQALTLETARLEARKSQTQTAATTRLLEVAATLPAEATRLAPVRAHDARIRDAHYELERLQLRLTSLNAGLPPAPVLQKIDSSEQVTRRTLPPPADAAQRRAAFARRNDPAHLGELALRFFRLIDPQAKGVAPAVSLYKQGKHAEARLADAMNGVVCLPAGKGQISKVDLGPPGSVNWAYTGPESLPPSKDKFWFDLARSFHTYLYREPLRSLLLDGYFASSKVEYLQRFAEYVDDWAINSQRDLNHVPPTPMPVFRPETPLGEGEMLDVYNRSVEAAVRHLAPDGMRHHDQSIMTQRPVMVGNLRVSYSDGQPIEGRWHTCQQFDFAEGICQGVYEELPPGPGISRPWSSYRTGGYAIPLHQVEQPAVTDVSRMVRS